MLISLLSTFFYQMHWQNLDGRGIRTTEDTQNVHIIQPGDTLWGIINTYYGSPDQWPSLWSYNETISPIHTGFIREIVSFLAWEPI